MDTASVSRATQFQTEGYLVVREILSPEFVQRLGTFLAQSVEDSIDELRAELGVENRAEIVAEIDRRFRIGPPLPSIPKHIAMGHFPLATRLSHEFWGIADESALIALLSELVGSEELMLHLPPTARFVLPGNGIAGVPAHQDFRYNTHLPSDFVTVWVPFVEVDDDCGGVIVFNAPRSRELPLLRAEGPWLGGVDATGYSGHHVKLVPGDALLLDSTVLHASAPNGSDRVRISTDFRFFSGRSGKAALRLRDRIVIPAEDEA